MSRPELKGKIQTVLGPIEPGKLGRTLMHEHVLCDIRPPGTRSDNDLGPEITLENVWQINYGHGIKRAGRKYMLDLEDIATREVAMMKHEGGDAIVELSCGGLSPDPNGLRRIAAGTGVHLVMGCGYYVNDYQDPKNHDRTVDDCLELMELIKPVGLKHVGFKDVGVAPEVLKKLTDAIHATGAVSYMEVVSTTPEACLASAKVARDLGVQRLLGGTQVKEIMEILKGSKTEDNLKEAFAGEAALKAGGAHNTMNQFAA